MIQKAEKFAVSLHKDRNILYDGNSYDLHLTDVFLTAKRFLHLIDEEDRDYVLAACYLHDTLEDCAISYNDLVKEFNNKVADIVYDVTNELGKSRKERAYKTYPKIANNKLAVFVKLCDRIANMSYSKFSGSSMYDKYKKELNDFVINISYNYQYQDLIDQLYEI